ncbi:MAG: VOC family protein [bacterium]
MSQHAVIHLEWSSTDLVRSQAFLAGLFPDWKFEPWSEDYLMFTFPNGEGGGLQKVERVVAGDSPVVYFEVAEIEPYQEKAVALGGTVSVPKTEIPTMGWFAHLRDQDDNLFGIFQPLPREK